MPQTKPPRWPWFALVAIYLALRLPAFLSYAPTYDEPIYLGAGMHFAKVGDPQTAAMLYHPPLAYHLSSLLLWPFQVTFGDWDPHGFGSQAGLRVLYDTTTAGGSALSPETVLGLARLPILLLGLLGLPLCRALGRRIAGETCGWLAAAAWAAYPEAAAQSVQATTDLVAAIAALLLACAAIRHFDWVAEKPQYAKTTHLALGAACGLAALAKHTLLVPIVVVAVASVILRIVRTRRGVAQPGRPFLRFLAAAIVAFAVLWAGYLFEFGPVAARTAAETGAGHEHSAAIARWTPFDAATIDGWMETVPIPAPTYVRSVADAFLDKARARSGSTWVGYMDGAWSDRGFLAYFPYALAVKTPLALLLLLAAGPLGWWLTRRNAAPAADLCFALFILPFAAAVASRLNIGIRHLLPAVPFLMILGCAALARLGEEHPLPAKALAGLLAAMLAAEWAVNRLDPLPFANVAAGGPSHLLKRLTDTNLEAGQDLWEVERWCEEHRVTSIHVLLHDPQGLYDRERARHPYLLPRDGMRPAAFVDAIRPQAQTGDVPATGLLALGESEMTRLAWVALQPVEPLARVGRTRIYVVAR